MILLSQNLQNEGCVYNDAFHGSLRCFARVVKMPCTSRSRHLHRGIKPISTTRGRHLNEYRRAGECVMKSLSKKVTCRQEAKWGWQKGVARSWQEEIILIRNIKLIRIITKIFI